MSAQAIEPLAVAECVRETLDQFLADHPNLEGLAVEVGQHAESDGGFGLTIEGFIVEVSIREPGR